MAARKLGRAADHRRAMLRGLVTYLLEKGKLVTTVTRAKEVRSEAEKIITKAKGGTLHDKRQVFSYITKEDVAKKTIDIISPSFSGENGGVKRTGGYTRITRIGPRRGDAAEMALIEVLFDEKSSEEPSVNNKAKKTKKAKKSDKSEAK